MSALPRSLFTARLPGIGRGLTQAEGVLFSNYMKLLSKWQKTHRLVGSVEPAWIIENVLLDSLCFLDVLPPGVARLADLGSGAGIPGIPIAIVRRDMRLCLIESRQRRASFLSTVVRELALDHVEVVADRAENLGPDYGARFDAVVMRCAGEPRVVLGIASRLAHAGGVIVASAGPSAKPGPGAEALTVRTPSGTLRRFHRYEVTPNLDIDR